MDLFLMLLTTIMVPISYIWSSRIISMTYKTFSRSITIRNDKLAKALIAEKNMWGIATDLQKRNKMSIWGVISYVVFVPQIAFIPYNWWVFIKTGSGQWCEAERSYWAIAILYYAVVLSIKLKEAIRFCKGDIG